jgi:hypothetical protein
MYLELKQKTDNANPSMICVIGAIML